MKKYIPQVTFDRSNNILSHFANLSLNLIDIDRFFYILNLLLFSVHVFNASLIRIMNNESTMNGNQKVDVNFDSD